MTTEVVSLAAAVLLLVFALGYGLGRRQGTREGFDQGVRFAPLAMRKASWERGSCILCGWEQASDPHHKGWATQERSGTSRADRGP